MNTTISKNCLLFIALLLFIVACAPELKQIYIQSDLLPIDNFNKADINAIAVLNFDASAVKEKGIDNIALRDAIAYDITKGLYDLKKVRVIQGQAVQSVQEKEMLQSTKGDYEAASSTIERLVTYKYNPYQKVDAVLSGSVLRYFKLTDDPGMNYIELIIRLVDNVDGTIYWVTKIRGNYKDVIYTIVHTLSHRAYTEPELPKVSLPTLPPSTVPPKK